MRRLLLLCVCLALAACDPDSTHPAADPETAVFDARLQGAWRATGSDDPVYAYVGPASEGGRRVQIMLVEQKDDGSWKTDAYEGLTAAHGDHGLLSVREAGGDAKAGWLIVRYAVHAPNHIEVRSFDRARLAALVREGTLAGRVTKSALGDEVHLTAATSALVTLLESPAGEQLFAAPLTFTRLESSLPSS